MTAEIVNDDDIAGRQRRHEHLLDVSQKALAVDGVIDDAGCIDTVAAQGGEKGQRAPVAAWSFGNQPVAAQAAPMRPRHVGLGPGLIDKDQPPGIKIALITLPTFTPPFDVGPVLFGRVQAFF